LKEMHVDEAVSEIIKHMENQHLTCVELDFRNGWKFKLVHPKRHAKLLRGGNPYSDEKRKQEIRA